MTQIRLMQAADVAAIDAGFRAQNWPPRTAVLQSYWQDQQAGRRQVFVAEQNGVVAGYLTLVPRAAHGPFAGQLPEVTDFNVFAAFRQQGIGTALLDAAENVARTAGATVISLGVGLHAGYGPAQRLYVRRGYVPDGSGVWYQDRPLPQEASCRNDDALVLYLSKPLFS
ncbi:GNAT family N-acetyltransferase [Lacticaseibacillus mingshuiensis]|uniref:GNAT family N-acetyltransferase n=1 Tax=Lacticaseibacillus mingshuiensis TaxID=2799574 RepID=A0ABW4CFP4_9LACO|nr:GNAT family N-acetyltransferase [Lacticaseibacillus mingshuiensis]